MLWSPFPARAKRAPPSVARASRARKKKGTITWAQSDVVMCHVSDLHSREGAFYQKLLLYAYNCAQVSML